MTSSEVILSSFDYMLNNYDINREFRDKVDKYIFDGINVNLSKLTGRLSFKSLRLQDGQIHTYSLAMIMFATVAIFIMILLG